MTLLEAVIAVVILGLSAVGYLDIYRSSAAATRDAREWARLVATAETAMEGATLGDAVQARAGLPEAVAEAVAGPQRDDAARERDGPAPMRAHVEVRPWGEGVREIVVTVTSARGTRFVLHRLARERRP